jgi:hypothetical protein
MQTSAPHEMIGMRGAFRRPEFNPDVSHHLTCFERSLIYTLAASAIYNVGLIC